MKRAASLLVLVAGCYSATIHVSPMRPYTPTMPVISDAWHVSVLGVIEVSDPVSLGICPVAEIYEEEGLAAAIVGGMFGVAIMDTTVTCPMQAPPVEVPWSGPPGAEQAPDPGAPPE